MNSKTKKSGNVFYVLLKGTLTGLLISALIILIVAFISTKEDIKTDILPYFVLIAGGAGSLISSFFNTRKLKLKGLLAGLISGLVFSGIFLILIFVLSGFSAKLFLFITIPVNIFTALLGMVISKNIG